MRFAKLRQTKQLILLRPGDLLKILDQDVVHLLMQGHDLDFGLKLS